MSKKKKNRLLIEIDQKKKESFQKLCLKNQTNMTQLINDFIDSYLSKKTILNDNIKNQIKTDIFPQQQIELMIQNSIIPLQKQIDELNSKIQEIQLLSSTVNIKTDDDKNSIKEEDKKFIYEKGKKQIEEIEEIEEINLENRSYLTRHETWQILKKTDYVKTHGYDSFLNSTPDELKAYDIYFDNSLKRYYLTISDE